MSDLIKQAGVYRITCKPTGKFYIGSAYCFRSRWNLHKVMLRKGKHDSKHLQHSWNKYGSDAFDFEVLLVCDKANVLMYEQIFLDALQPVFNTHKIAGSAAGHRHSKEAKHHMSRAQRDRRIKYAWRGSELCLSDIAEMEQFNPTLLIARVLGLGKTVEEALAMGDSQIKLHEYDGRQQNLSAWAKEFGVHVARLKHYIKRGLTLEQAVQAINRSEKSISFQEFCKISGANASTVKSRVFAQGMGVMEAITKPVGPTGARRKVEEITQ